MDLPIIIVGSGLAGYTLAKELRKLNSELPLQIITADDGAYYSKPQLSSAVGHHKTAEMLAAASAEKMAQQLNATILTHTTVKKIDAQNKQIHLDQQTLSYSTLVLAQGAEVIKLNCAGTAAKEILSVNNLEDYKIFRAAMKDKKRITIVGSGLVGCEFTNDLLNGGYEVDVVALAKTPLDLLLPAELGEVFQQELAAKTVTWHLECSIQSVDYHADGLLVLLSDGSTFTTDLVLSAIGLRPNLELANTANLSTQRGIQVDQFLRTSDSSIYALGDCAEVMGHLLYYVAPLVIGARALAHTLCGNETALHYPPMPVILKTPACPVVVSSPPRAAQGTWKISGDKPDKKALFYNSENQLQGFILMGKAVIEKMALTKELPNLL